MKQEIDLIQLLGNIRNNLRKYKWVFLALIVVSISASAFLYSKARNKYESIIVLASPEESGIKNTLINQVVTPLLGKLNANQEIEIEGLNVENVFGFESLASASDNLVVINYSYYDDFDKTGFDNYLVKYVNENDYISFYNKSMQDISDDVYDGLNSKIELLNKSLKVDSANASMLDQESVLTISVLEELKFKLHEIQIEQGLNIGVRMVTKSEDSKILVEKSLPIYIGVGVLASIFLIFFILLFLEIFKK